MLLVLLFFKTRLGGIIKPNVSKSKLNHKRCKKPCSFLPPGTFRGSTEVREPRYNPRTKTGIWINRRRWVSLQMCISRSLGGLIYLLHSNMNSALKKSCKTPCSDFFFNVKLEISSDPTPLGCISWGMLGRASREAILRRSEPLNRPEQFGEIRKELRSAGECHSPPVTVCIFSGSWKPARVPTANTAGETTPGVTCY